VCVSGAEYEDRDPHYPTHFPRNALKTTARVENNPTDFVPAVNWRPMNFTPRPISQHQRARLIAWTLSMLLWTLQALFAAALSPRHERQRRERMSLDWLTRQVKLLIISRANALARLRIRRHQRTSYRSCRNVLKPGVINALIGVRLRRRLNRKGLIERITTLVHALHHIDAYAAHVAERLGRGLTRRCLHLFALPPTPAAPLVTLATPSAHFADSS